jgi:hypothetical protein
MVEHVGRAQRAEHAMVDHHVGQGEPERQPVLVEGDDADHHEEVEVHLDHAAGQVHQDRRGAHQAQHGRRRAGPPAELRPPGQQCERRHQRRLRHAVGQALAANGSERGQAGHVQPQQHDDAAVAPRPDLRGEQLPVRERSPGRACSPGHRAAGLAHALKIGGPQAELGALTCGFGAGWGVEPAT